MFKRIGVVLTSMAALAVAHPSFAKQSASCDQVTQLVGKPDVLKTRFTEEQIHACTGGVVIWVQPYIPKESDSIVSGHWEFRPSSTPVGNPVQGE